MRRVLSRLHEQTNVFSRHPLFIHLRDDRIDPLRRLSFAPALAHFVMTFADLYRFVLREDPPRDQVQEFVNAHTLEDGGHWKWFLADLEKLGQDPEIAFSDALRFLWGDETVGLRMLSYGMCRLGLGASSLHKLVLVSCIEATGSVTLRNVGPVGAAAGRLTGKNLVYFGSHHSETEASHTLEKDEVRAVIEGITLTTDMSHDLSSLVDRAFALFTSTADEMLSFAIEGRRLRG